MNLKEAFRYQNKLQSFMDEAQEILDRDSNVTKVENTYLRHKVMAEAEDETVVVTPDTEYYEQITGIAQFLLYLLGEKEALFAAIRKANAILVVTMHDCRISKSGARCNQSAESLGHILFGNSEVLSCGRETEHLILIESNSEIKVIPLSVLYDHRCLGQIVQDIRDFSKQCFIGSEDLL